MSDTAKLDNAPPERMPTAIGLRHLRYVELSAICGSFRKAAVTLGVQQSAVSRRIRDLADALGAALFIRHSGGVVLTEAGTRFVRNVRRALTVLDQAAADVSAVGRGEQGVIRIGIFSSLASGFLARLLTVYGEQHPDVEIDIFEAAPADHILAVRQFRLDLAFVVGTPHLSDCDSAEFWTESIHVVLPQTHPLAAHTEILWRDLRGETFILSERGLGSEVSNFLVKHLGDLGAPPCIEWHSVGRDNLMQLVALGRGVTLTSAATVAMKFPGVVYRPLHGETLPFCAVWSPQNDNPAFRRFLSLARTLATGTGTCSCPNRLI